MVRNSVVDKTKRVLDGRGCQFLRWKFENVNVFTAIQLFIAAAQLMGEFDDPATSSRTVRCDPIISSLIPARIL